MPELPRFQPEKSENNCLPPHELLPAHEDLNPITDKNSTFSDTYFNKPFDHLGFGEKLRVVSDIIRQSILPDYYSDPTSEEIELRGDCHATARLAIKYLRYLNIGVSHDYAMVNRRPFDPPEKNYSKHAFVIVTDADGSQWQLDPAPWIGYGFGTVSKMNTSDQLIDNFSIINDEAAFIIDRIKDLRIIARSGKRLSTDDTQFYREIIQQGEKYDYLRGFVGEAFAALALQTNDTNNRQNYADKAIALDPYRGGNSDVLPFASHEGEFLVARQRLREFTERQCLLWEEELRSISSNRDSDVLEKQLVLAQLIANERKFSNPSLVSTINIDGNEYPATSFTPRFMKEAGLNIAIIKPSASFIGVSASVRESLRRHTIRGQYSIDPTLPTETTGIVPLLFSHSLAGKFERSYNGINTVLFMGASAHELYETKKRIRRELGSRIVGKQVKWTDGHMIEWHPHSMNYLHSTDNPQEAALHALFGMPEFSLMNRWMYPNPNLV